MLVGCEAPEETKAEAYFSPVLTDKKVSLKANQPVEQLLEVEPALCYRIRGTASNDPITVTVVDDGGAPVRTTTSRSGSFEIGEEHGFCVRVVRGPYYIRLSSKADSVATLSVQHSQSGGI